MAALLLKIFDESDWRSDPSKQQERIRYYRGLLAHGLSPAQAVAVRLQLGNELLEAGDSPGAVQTFEELNAQARLDSVDFPPAATRRLHERLALAYLRLGEQENCQQMHGARSCLFPIHGSGIHQNRRGAQGAVRELTLLLQQNPADDLSRWLLNIAYMQLGEYPERVPAVWLIPESRFASEYEIGKFPDVAPQAGLAATGHAGGVAVEDFDGDGLLDVMLSSSGPRDQLRFFHNNGDGTFSERTLQAGLLGETGGLNLTTTDYNNDGCPDVLVLRGGWWARYGDYPMSLLRNNCNGTFEDVTERAGLMSAHPTQTAAWADYDNDGWLDLFVGHESTRDDPHPSQLFHNNHDGTFTEVGERNGLAALGYVKGAAWGDFNNDGRPDLYVSVMGGANHLFRNDGPRDPRHPRPETWKFTDITEQAAVAEPRGSFATWFFDYDNDGWPDIFVAGYSGASMQDVGAFEMGKPFGEDTPRLYRNNHDGTFTDVTKAVHLDRAILAMGADFGDLDNDGWLDIYLGTGSSPFEALLPNHMFRNREGKIFQDVTTAGGFGHLQKGHGISFADLENDGNEDVLEEMGGALPGDSFQTVLYRNSGHGHPSITLQLEGVRTNRAANGARIELTFHSEGKLRHVYRTVGYGSSFGSNPWRQHIGVSNARSIDRLEIRWPVSHTVQRFTNLPVNRAFHIREGSSRPDPIQWKKFSFQVIPDTPGSMAMGP